MVYLIILLSALTFALSFIVNDFVFHSFGLSDYVSLIFIPSGVRIFFALVFGVYGVIGIVLGSSLVSLSYLNEANYLVVMSTALVAGGAAWLARVASVKLFELDADLSRITLLQLLQVSIVFSAVSSISHHLLFLELGMAEDFTTGVMSMFAGDVAGALLCLLCARYTVRLLRYKNS
jgi:hypothetical protein